MKVIKDNKEYIIGTIPVVLSYIGGIVFTFGWKYSYIVGSVLFFVTIALSIYVLRKFDARPDVAKARSDIKEYSEKLLVLKKNYDDIKSKAEEANLAIQNLKSNIDKVNLEVMKSNSKLDNVNTKANISLITTGIRELQNIMDE